MTVCEDLASLLEGKMACGHVCHSVIGTILQIGSSIGHAGQIALGGIAVIAPLLPVGNCAYVPVEAVLPSEIVWFCF